MLKKEQLMAMGLTEEQASKVVEAHKEVLNGQYVPKSRLDEEVQAKKDALEQVAARDNQIKDLKKFEGDATALQERIAALEAENTTKATEYKNELIRSKKLNAVKFTLSQDGKLVPHDLDMVVNMLDLDLVTLDDNGNIVSGYAEQATKLQTDRAFLFKSAENKDGGSGGEGSLGSHWRPKGTSPAGGAGGLGDGEGGSKSATFGSSLAAKRLASMGIDSLAGKSSSGSQN